MNAHENAEEAGDSQPIAGVRLPRVVFGSSSLGNLFEATSDERAAEIVGEWLRTQQGEGGPPVTIDSAGKYGAGLALERLGKQLRRYEVAPEQVQISNKLGWFRVPLRGAEPTFEPGAWVGIANDAELRISKRGIVDCWEQGCELLGDPYRAQLLSVHDPDEYLASAEDAADRKTRRRDLFAAYESLAELKARGEAAAVGVGAKDWRVCKEVADEAPLDWVMIANSLTIYSHPHELLEWVQELADRGVAVINSAVFNAGFLVGGAYFDYRRVSREDEADRPLFAWRDKFHALCQRHDVAPAAACVAFGVAPPGVAAVALNTSNPKRIAEFDALAAAEAPDAFWLEAKDAGLIDSRFPLPAN